MCARFATNNEQVKNLIPDIEEKLYDFKCLQEVTLNVKNKASAEYRTLNYATDLAFIEDANESCEAVSVQLDQFDETKERWMKKVDDILNKKKKDGTPVDV